MALSAGLYVLLTLPKVILAGLQLLLLHLFNILPPRTGTRREMFDRLAQNEWALWTIPALSLLILVLGIRCVFGGIRAYRSGEEVPFSTYAAMMMTGILLQTVRGAEGLRDFRTELLGPIFIFGMPWTDGIESRLRNFLRRSPRQ